MFYFVFVHPQFLSLSYFPSSDSVTHLCQQLHIQLVTSDVSFHSAKERFKNANMGLNVRKKKKYMQCLCLIVWSGLSSHKMQRSLGRQKMTIQVHGSYAAQAEVLSCLWVQCSRYCRKSAQYFLSLVWNAWTGKCHGVMNPHHFARLNNAQWLHLALF